MKTTKRKRQRRSQSIELEELTNLLVNPDEEPPEYFFEPHTKEGYKERRDTLRAYIKNNLFNNESLEREKDDLITRKKNLANLIRKIRKEYQQERDENSYDEYDGDNQGTSGAD